MIARVELQRSTFAELPHKFEAGTPNVADAIGLRLIMAKRREVLGKAQELPPVPKHIQLADTRHGIGTSDMNAIELIKLGWGEDILV